VFYFFTINEGVYDKIVYIVFKRFVIRLTYVYNTTQHNPTVCSLNKYTYIVIKDIS